LTGVFGGLTISLKTTPSRRGITMIAVPLILTSAAKHIYHYLHEAAHDDMARQASGWISDEARAAKIIRNNEQPIKLDFGVPKKHRLNWIHRATHHLPH